MADILTSTTNLSTLLPTYYSKRLLERLEPNCRAYQLADKKRIPANSGKVILWNRYVQLGAGLTLTEGTTPGPSAMSTTTVSATLTQKGNLVKITDLVDECAISDVVRDTVDVLADNAALTIDQYILDNVGWYASAVGPLQSASVTVFSYQFPIAYSKTSGALDGEGGFDLGASVNLANNAAKILTLNVSAIRVCVTKLRARNVPPHDDGYYHALVHPHGIHALKSDTQWATWN